ncbi:MAG: DTW domain-containing protein YfiP [Psychromonas sp.]|jgi:DTW domain-containing protein YfiP|uniref:tRNA-uridine aminocarboxypropyltransferase n=1 Tax=Psychromonas sp. TaxID=1884585 RepID=UPI0039E3A70F
MSKRAVCKRCLKAQSACICSAIQLIDNQHFVHVLQDPGEEKNAIGTARILGLSLKRSKISVGTLFDPSLFDLQNSYLVFPDPSAVPAEQLSSTQLNDRSVFILLDGSWKKAYKLLMSNPFLQNLPKISINIDKKSEYRIRKSPRADGLSTVEAGYYLLSQLEKNQQKFIPLLTTFNKMIDYQIASMPAEIYKKHYLDKKPKSEEMLK